MTETIATETIAPVAACSPPAAEGVALPRSRRRTLEVVDALAGRIRSGRWAAGDKLPTEAEIMAEHGVSRTVVREALSKLQASGLVQTRHGVGTFVAAAGDGLAFRIGPEQLATLHDVIAMLELRIALETEAAGLAARRRGAADLAAMRGALAEFAEALEAGRDAVSADYRFHLAVAAATGNAHFPAMLGALGTTIIPRARAGLQAPQGEERVQYLRQVNREHQSILDAIENEDPDAARAAMRTHLSNSKERRRKAAAEAGRG